MASSEATFASSGAVPHSALAILISLAVISIGGHARRLNGSPIVTCRPVAMVAARSTTHFCKGEGTKTTAKTSTNARRTSPSTPTNSLRMVHLPKLSPPSIGVYHG